MGFAEVVMPEPMGSRTLLGPEVGGSIGEVAAVDEPERDWVDAGWALKLLWFMC